MYAAQTQNPIIPVQAVELSDEARYFAARIINRSTGRLLASKPKVQYRQVDNWVELPNGMLTNRATREPVGDSGKIAYVWRMVAFQIGTRPADHCMPCTADFDLPERDYTRRRELAKQLDAVVEAIVNTVPKAEWHGIRRWGNALGMVGQPEVAASGAVLYR